MMIPILARLFGERKLHAELDKRSGGLVSVPLGFRLLRDRRISLRPKLISVAVGCLLLAGLLAVEFPVETIVATLLIGIPLDAAIDGLEIAIAPVIFTALALPWIAPRALVESIRDENHPAKLHAEPKLIN